VDVESRPASRAAGGPAAVGSGPLCIRCRRRSGVSPSWEFCAECETARGYGLSGGVRYVPASPIDNGYVSGPGSGPGSGYGSGMDRERARVRWERGMDRERDAHDGGVPVGRRGYFSRYAGRVVDEQAFSGSETEAGW
jgi:hypothetical protein